MRQYHASKRHQCHSWIIWLPCVASGHVKTNLSAKPVTLVSDKRREPERDQDGRRATIVKVWPHFDERY